jgi:hypothetical protein
MHVATKSNKKGSITSGLDVSAAGIVSDALADQHDSLLHRTK